LKYSNPKIKEGINTTETSPLKEFSFLTVTVLTAVILLTALVAVSVDYLAGYVPFDTEVSLSQDIAEKLNAKDNEIDQYLQHLANKIVPHMNLPQGMSVTLHYVNNDTVNAMATLGGHIIVYRGLLEKMPNENALLMLIGHEIGHVKLRHPIKALGKGVVLSLIMASILGDASDAVSGIMGDSSMIMMLSYSRDQEQVADDEGISGLNALYGHVEGATELFEIFKKQSKESLMTPPQFLSSHPDLDNRIAYLTDMAVRNSWYQTGVLSAIPSSIVKKLSDDNKSREQTP